MSGFYGNNPFDMLDSGVTGRPSGTQSESKPIPQATSQQQHAETLDDLINPFAVLGLDNDDKSSSTSLPHPQASGASCLPSQAPSATTCPPPQLVAPQPVAMLQALTPTSQSLQPRINPSSQSIFQPPAPIFTQQVYTPSVSPAFGSSPSSAYGQASPAYGSYSPTSPAFDSSLHTGKLGYLSLSPSPVGSGGSAKVVTDADLTLFAGPSRSPTPAPASPTPITPHLQQGAPPATSQHVTDGWDNDDFGISWDAPEATSAETQPEKPEPAAPVEDRFRQGSAVESPYASQGKTLSPTEAAIAAEHKTEGTILARISVRTLIVKEWKDTFWTINKGKLLLYRSREDFLYNPVGVMVKKDIPLCDNLRCSEVTCKPYKGYGDLYHFTLEEMLDYGPSLVAKFASSRAKSVRELRAVIVAYIIAERKKRLRARRRSPGSPRVYSSSPYAQGGDYRQHQRSPTVGRTGPRTASPKAGSEASGASGAGGLDKYAKWGQIS